ncbi:MAG: glycosyltransferase family 39 protein, partial [Chloroflexi bacterium]|nr:glycosyltransferase family 39 protein [Chloroflexota bacterium]
MVSDRPSTVNRQSSLVMLAICLLAFVLRLGPLYDNRFHPDEALFSTWSLTVARGENPLLTGVPIDKPPLLIYLNAISFYVFGQSELAARVPNLIASVVSVVLVWRLGISRLGTGRLVIGQSVTSQPVDPLTNLPIDQFTNLLPPLLFALSPFAISFAPTAFLDPMMIMFGLASLVAASRGRSGWAGILLGLSFAAKVQGLFFAPLIWVFSKQVDKETRKQGVSLLRLALGLGIVTLLVLAWDRARGGLPFWQQQTINYGDLRLIFLDELGPRLMGWLSFLPYFFGPIVGLVSLIGLPQVLRVSIRGRRLLLWLSGIFVLHWLFNFPIWDRYVLLLVPIAAVLIGRALGHLVTSSPLHSISPSLILAIITIVALPFTAAAAESQYPIGGDHGANDGIDQVAMFLKTLPSGTVLYDHWLAWELGYYVGRGFVYVSYFDTPAALRDDLRV